MWPDEWEKKYGLNLNEKDIYEIKNIYDSDFKRDGFENLVNLLKDAVEKDKNKHIVKAKEFDVSSDLTDDAKAKLTLLHSDCVVIPADKLKEYIESIK